MAQRRSEFKPAKTGSGTRSNIGRAGPEPSVSEEQGRAWRENQDQSMQGPLRRSIRSRRTEDRHRQSAIEEPTIVPQARTRKRKRTSEAEDSPAQTTAASHSKRRQTCPFRVTVEVTSGKEQSRSASGGKVNPIDYWRREGRWPEEYFERQSEMSHLLARKMSSSSLRRKQSEAGSAASSGATPSDQQQRGAKSAPYRDPRYKASLATKGSFMDKSEQGITDTSKQLCHSLLERKQPVPADSSFRDDVFESTCRKMQDRNETRVIRDISLLIVPSAEISATYGAVDSQQLVESTNEGWHNAIPVTSPRPQPDYAVGFKREAFADEQSRRLQPFVGESTDTSYFMATYYMYFPFSTSEVKCGAAALDVADRQNAHSMTLAVRGVVELFRVAEREKEVDREILAFSISHDHSTVRIYGHYPVIEGKSTAFYRHPIRKFDFTEQDGREKWTAYKFTKNIYDVWMPAHFARICSAIDELPSDIAFEVSEQSGSRFSEATGLSQGVEGLFTEPSVVDTEFLRAEGSGHGSLADPQDVTPNTSLSPGTRRGTSKRSKKRRTVT